MIQGRGPSFLHTIPSPLYQAAWVRGGTPNPTLTGCADSSLFHPRQLRWALTMDCGRSRSVWCGDTLLPFASRQENRTPTSIFSHSQNC